MAQAKFRKDELLFFSAELCENLCDLCGYNLASKMEFNRTVVINKLAI